MIVIPPAGCGRRTADIQDRVSDAVNSLWNYFESLYFDYNIVKFAVERLHPNSSQAAQAAGDMLDRQRLDAFTHARLWRNPCGFAARFNYLALRYNDPLYGWVRARFGLSRVEFVVIYSLMLMEGVTASEIASSTAFPKNTLSRAVARLETLGLIMRGTGHGDRRTQPLLLTRRGRAVLDEAVPRFVALEAEMLAPLSLVEREQLATLMAKVVLAMFHGNDDVQTAGKSSG